jgi:hypothetical protein
MHGYGQGYGQVVYDGFGNPVGLFPGVAMALRNLIRGNRAGIAPRPIRQFLPPVGWVTTALPYTGTQPRRMYLRCSTWPGEPGLVPAFAMQPGPGQPGGPGGRGGRRRRRRMRRR